MTLPIIPPFDYSCPNCKGDKFEQLPGGVYRCEKCRSEYPIEDFATDEMMRTRRMISGGDLKPFVESDETKPDQVIPTESSSNTTP